MTRNRQPNPDVLMWVVLIVLFSSMGGALAASLAIQLDTAMAALRPYLGAALAVMVALLLFRMYWRN